MGLSWDDWLKPVSVDSRYMLHEIERLEHDYFGEILGFDVVGE
jgi:hypothetical protein